MKKQLLLSLSLFLAAIPTFGMNNNDTIKEGKQEIKTEQKDPSQPIEGYAPLETIPHDWTKLIISYALESASFNDLSTFAQINKQLNIITKSLIKIDRENAQKIITRKNQIQKLLEQMPKVICLSLALLTEWKNIDQISAHFIAKIILNSAKSFSEMFINNHNLHLIDRLTPLNFAVMSGNIYIIQSLIRAGESLNPVDKQGTKLIYPLDQILFFNPNEAIMPILTMEEKEAIAIMLLNAGTIITDILSNGLDIATHAKQSGYSEELVSLLQKTLEEQKKSLNHN